MRRAKSIHFGLNAVDPQHYQGWQGLLRGCENDARDMERLARSAGFDTRTFLTRNATRAALASALQEATLTLRAGDTFLMTISSHGGQLQDISGEEADRLDETQCLFDGEWRDDETVLYLQRFQPGVRAVIMLDCCHSGTGARDYRNRRMQRNPSQYRAIPQDLSDEIYAANKSFYDRTARRTAGVRREDLRTPVVTLSACRDSQLARDGSTNGLFTESVLRAWNSGSFKGNYSHFHRAVQVLIPARYDQNPELNHFGEGSEALLNEAPFSIGGRTSMSQSPSGSAPAVNPGPTVGSTPWKWGLPQSSDKGTGARSSNGRRPVEPGPRRAYGFGSPGKQDRSDPGREPAIPGSLVIPAVTLTLEELLADSDGTRGTQSVDELLTGLGESFIDGDRVEWTAPADIPDELARYLSASVQELNNKLQAGLLDLASDGSIAFSDEAVLPEGTYVTSTTKSNDLYVISNRRRQRVTPDVITREGLTQSDIQQLDPATLLAIPLDTAPLRAVGQEVTTYLWSDLRAGHFMQSWAWLQGTALTTRTVTESVTWFGGYTGGVRFNLYDAEGRAIQHEIIRYRYGCDGRAFGSGRRDETEVVQIPQDVADRTASILVSHYWDPKVNLVDILIDVAEFVWEAIKKIAEAQENGQAVNAGNTGI
ncbi:caspase family protein [Streptomyces sp. NPDC056479]|uniref:caspase family protein n=1 Tax=Streptomyces sp. NPDC056479 TaxID=3345832 RepID=UPI0036BC63E8